MFKALREKIKLMRKDGGKSEYEQLQARIRTNIQNTDLGNMTVSIHVSLPGGKGVPCSLALSRCLVADEDMRLADSYHFESFLSLFEAKINSSIPEPPAPISIRHGELTYIDSDGLNIRIVADQDDFEVALNTLYGLRDTDAILQLLFKPESEEEKAIRLYVRPVPVASEVEFAAEVRDAVVVDGGGPNMAAKETPLGHMSMHSQGGHGRPPTRASVGSVSTAPQSGVLSPTLSNERSDSRTSTSSPLQRVRTFSHKLRGKETPIERRQRLKSLWEVSAPVAYKKGGDEDEDEELEEQEAREKDDEDGVVEDEEEDDEGDEISQEDKVVIRLQDMLNLLELDQLKDPEHAEDDLYRWKECCEMFGIDYTKTGIEELVPVAGLKTKIYQYQAFGIYWQMITSRKHGGGFVADDMGLGKTLSFLAYIVVERQLSCLWQAVTKSREVKDGLHLSVEDQDGTQRCPSPWKAGWIACPCSQANPTSTMKAKPGLRLAIVPTALVKNWWEQWKIHINTAVAELGLNIVVDHKGAFDHHTPIEDLACRSDNGRAKARIQAERYRGKGGKGDDMVKPHQDGYFIISTKENFPECVKKHHTYEGFVRVEGKNTWAKGKRVQLVFGIAMIDECHEEAQRSQGRSKILLDLPKVNEPFLWGYSGTPISLSPRGLEGVLWAIEKHTQWNEKKHLNYPAFGWKHLNEIVRQYNEYKNTKFTLDGLDLVLDQFKPFLTTFILRRVQTTRWFGHPLIKLKPHIHQDVKLTARGPLYTPQEIEKFEASFQSEKDAVLKRLQDKWDNTDAGQRTTTRPAKLPFNLMCREQWRLSVLSTFPYLLNLATADEENSRLTLTEHEALLMRGSDNKEKDSGYFKNLKAIVETSPKALWLFDFIDNLDGRRDVNVEVERLVIVTQFPQVAFILKLFIQRYFPAKKDKVGLVTGRMTLREKAEVIDSFTGRSTNSKSDVQILIGTTRLLGVGLQLTRACNIVLMEPDHHYVRELQGYARVHRIGQKNPVSYSYRLIDEGSEIEARVVKRQEDRKERPGKKLSEEEFLKWGITKKVDVSQSG